MSKINNEIKKINANIFSALKESAQAEASRWESIEEPSYKDRDEAEYYRNKELYANSNLARHREAMDKAAEKCKEKGIKLDESAPYRRYKVSFYVDTNEMNNIDIEEKVDEVLKSSGLASTDESIDVEMIEEFEESSLKEADSFQDFQNDWNEIINAINRVNVRTQKAKNLKASIDEYCRKVMQDVYNKAMS